MLKIGCHISSGQGYAQMARDALSIGADTFQFFTRNPRGAAVRAFDAADADELIALLQAHKMGPILAHAPYTQNACSKDEGLRALAARMMTEDLDRLEYFPSCMYNFHPGCHTGQGLEAGMEQIASMLNAVLRKGQRTLVLLETMAGKGSEVGASFEALRAILDRVEQSDRVGICMDTCHVFDAGYNIVDHLSGVLECFDRQIGLNRLHAVHLNDSANPLGSRKDRHARLGEGEIGLSALVRVINHPALRNLPFYLETPNALPGHKEEILKMKAMFRGASAGENGVPL